MVDTRTDREIPDELAEAARALGAEPRVVEIEAAEERR